MVQRNTSQTQFGSSLLHVEKENTFGQFNAHLFHDAGGLIAAILQAFYHLFTLIQHLDLALKVLDFLDALVCLGVGTDNAFILGFLCANKECHAKVACAHNDCTEHHGQDTLTDIGLFCFALEFFAPRQQVK